MSQIQTNLFKKHHFKKNKKQSYIDLNTENEIFNQALAFQSQPKKLKAVIKDLNSTEYESKPNTTPKKTQNDFKASPSIIPDYDGLISKDKSKDYYPKNNSAHHNSSDKVSFNKFSKDSGCESTSNDESLPKKPNADNFKVKYKTELCKYYEINEKCIYGDNCAYAHGKENLRAKITNTTAYRTKKCNQFFEKGFCPYGNRCQFAHAIKSNIINNPYDRKMSYTKTINTLSKIENIENIKTYFPKPRLIVFNEIIPSTEDIQSTLFEDIKEIIKENIDFRKEVLLSL